MTAAAKVAQEEALRALVYLESEFPEKKRAAASAADLQEVSPLSNTNGTKENRQTAFATHLQAVQVAKQCKSEEGFGKLCFLD